MSRPLREWFRFDLDFTDDPEVRDMYDQPSGAEMLKVWIAVLCTIYQSKGTLYRSELLWETLSERSRCEKQFVKDSVRYFTSTANWLRYDPGSDVIYSVRVNRELRDNFETSKAARLSNAKRWKNSLDPNSIVNPWANPERPFLYKKQRKGIGDASVNANALTNVSPVVDPITVNNITIQDNRGPVFGSAKQRPDPKGSASLWENELKSWEQFKDSYPWDWSKRGKAFNSARNHWALMTPADRELAVDKVVAYAEGFEVEAPSEYLINEYYKTV
jgi:hypothetical protein